MAVNIPGLDLSILRGATQGQAGQPILISGRFTAFGLGVPAFIRVFLEGPDYNPETTHFDSMASPFSGDYSVQIVPQKEGSYKVYSQAFPIPFLPTGPISPEPLLLLPPIAESNQPPLVIGTPTTGGVNAKTPTGTQFLATPPQTPIEVSVGAPGVSIVMPGAAAPTYVAPAAPPLAPAAPPTVYIPPTPPAAPAAPAAPVIVYPPVYPTAPTVPTVPEVPTVPTVPTVPEVPTPTLPTLQLPSFPSLPSSSMLGAPTSTLPSQWTIGQ
jgi:hypothetical protein